MAEPVDVIREFHKAFRNDIRSIDTAAFDAAKEKGGLDPTIERFRFFNEMLGCHATGEELAIFPAVEKVAPLVAEACVKDQRGMDSAYNELKTSTTERDIIKTVRAIVIFRLHLDNHLISRLKAKKSPNKDWQNAIVDTPGIIILGIGIIVAAVIAVLSIFIARSFIGIFIAVIIILVLAPKKPKPASTPPASKK
jgi:hypothetical protein